MADELNITGFSFAYELIAAPDGRPQAELREERRFFRRLHRGLLGFTGRASDSLIEMFDV